MSLSKTKLKRWGPKPLRELTGDIEKELNERSPIPGLGIYINETPNGRQISTHPSPGAQTQTSGDGSGAFPFQVSSAGNFAIKYEPGVVEITTPTLGSIHPITNPAAILAVGVGVTHLVLKVDFEYDGAFTGRYLVTEADIDVYTFPDPSLVWDDETRNTGTLYLKATDVTVDVDGNLTSTFHYLRDNIRVLAILGNQGFTFS